MRLAEKGTREMVFFLRIICFEKEKKKRNTVLKIYSIGIDPFFVRIFYRAVV